MAITTLDGAIAGMQPAISVFKTVTGTLVAGRPHSLFYVAGNPGAGVIPGAPVSIGVSGVALTSVEGQIPFTNPTSGQNTYLARISAQISQAGRVLLCDRLWHNSDLSVTTTTALDVYSVAFPARDANGTTNGEGVMIGMEVSSAGGAGTPTLSMSYTNQSGVSGKTGTGILKVVASSIQGAFYPIGLQTGDTGVRSIQTFTHNATMTQGSISLVAYRILASLDTAGALIPASIDLLTGGFPRLYDNTVPFFIFIPSTTTTSYFYADVTYTQG